MYLILGDSGTKTIGSGLDFLLGQVFLERFYSVYDTGKHRVGLAKTKFTDATTN
jgi:cathepsin E